MQRPSDAELLRLLHHDPPRAWDLFIDRHADTILRTLRGLGYDHDGAMDRFVFVCEKLVEDDCRRLRSVRHLGRDGEIQPWLRQVVRNLAINWAVSKLGRRRLLRSITRLRPFDQEVFKDYFWYGLAPSEICARRQADGAGTVRLLSVLESLERIFAVLSSKKLFRLTSNLLRRRGALSLSDSGPDGPLDASLTAPQPAPEERLLRREQEGLLSAALAALSPRERLLVQLRYEDGLSVRAAAEVLGIATVRAKSTLRAAHRKLRRLLSEADPSVGEGQRGTL